MLPKKIVTRVIRANGKLMETDESYKKKMKRNEGCEKVYDTVKREEKRRGEERRRDV